MHWEWVALANRATKQETLKIPNVGRWRTDRFAAFGADV
jgi:hypothetical protein